MIIGKGMASNHSAILPRGSCRSQKQIAFDSLEDSSNVDVALMCFANAKARLIRSGFKRLILCIILVAGVGFEPTTFRL